MEEIRDIHDKKLFEADRFTGVIRYQCGNDIMTFRLPVGEKIVFEKANSYTVVLRETANYLHKESIKLYKL